jgi:hypothetical protein
MGIMWRESALCRSTVYRQLLRLLHHAVMREISIASFSPSYYYYYY